GEMESTSVSNVASSLGSSSIGSSSTASSSRVSSTGSSTMGARTTMRTVSWVGSERATSHSQQSLQRRHFSQMWLLHASLVQRTQIRVDSSPQMLQVNGMNAYFFLPVVLAGVGAMRVA